MPQAIRRYAGQAGPFALPMLAFGVVCSGLLGCGHTESKLEARVDALEQQVKKLQFENERLEKLVYGQEQTIPVSFPSGVLRFPEDVERAMMGGPIVPAPMLPKVEKVR